MSRRAHPRRWRPPSQTSSRACTGCKALSRRRSTGCAPSSAICSKAVTRPFGGRRLRVGGGGRLHSSESGAGTLRASRTVCDISMEQSAVLLPRTLPRVALGGTLACGAGTRRCRERVGLRILVSAVSKFEPRLAEACKSTHRRVLAHQHGRQPISEPSRVRCPSEINFRNLTPSRPSSRRAPTSVSA